MFLFWIKKEEEVLAASFQSLFFSSLSLFPICLGRLEGSTGFTWGPGLVAQSGSALGTDTHAGFPSLGHYPWMSLDWSCLPSSAEVSGAWERSGASTGPRRVIEAVTDFTFRCWATLLCVALPDGEVKWHWRPTPKFLSQLSLAQHCFLCICVLQTSSVRPKWRMGWKGSDLLWKSSIFLFATIYHIIKRRILPWLV